MKLQEKKTFEKSLSSEIKNSNSHSSTQAVRKNRIKAIAKENPDLPLGFIKDLVVGLEAEESGNFENYDPEIDEN